MSINQINVAGQASPGMAAWRCLAPLTSQAEWQTRRTLCLNGQTNALGLMDSGGRVRENMTNVNTNVDEPSQSPRVKQDLMKPHKVKKVKLQSKGDVTVLHPRDYWMSVCRPVRE